MNADDILVRARVILKDTTHPGNIGATARAMKTMGLRRLILAAPRVMIDSNSRAMSSGALDVLANCEIHETLPPALTGCTHITAFSARSRELAPPAVSVREAAMAAARHLLAGGEAAFVFGGEKSGLTNLDVRTANNTALIPVSEGYRSLNLAQAVQIATYELRLALFAYKEEVEEEIKNEQSRTMPTYEQMEMLMSHFNEFLEDIDMPKRGTGELLQARMRILLSRMQPDHSEVQMLRGILRAARRRLADKK